MYGPVRSPRGDPSVATPVGLLADMIYDLEPHPPPAPQDRVPGARVTLRGGRGSRRGSERGRSGRQGSNSRRRYGREVPALVSVVGGGGKGEDNQCRVSVVSVIATPVVRCSAGRRWGGGRRVGRTGREGTME